MVYAATSTLERTQTTVSEAAVQQAKTARTIAFTEQKEALESARREAAEGGFFKWVSDRIGLGGVAGLATFDYALVAADVALHESGVVRDLRLDLFDGAALLASSPEILAADVLLRKTELTPDAIRSRLDAIGLGTSAPGISDHDVKPIVDRAIQLNLLVAGTAASILTAGSTTAIAIAIVGAALSVSGAVVQATGGSATLALGLQLAGCAASVTSGFFPSAAAGRTAGAARAAADGADALTTGTRGADTMMRALHQKAADDDNARAQGALFTLQRLGRVLDTLIDGVRETHESHKRVAEIIQGARETHDATLTMASEWRG
jgi:hypothetical protein